MSERSRWVCGGGIALGVGIMVGGFVFGPEPPGPAPSAVGSTPVASLPPPALDGEALYMANCATCHMADGGGVPNFQPGILDGPIVAAGAERVAQVIRAGSAVLRDRENEMGWEMPPFGFLSDAEIDALTAYVLNTFAPSASNGAR